ncbi:MAG: serine kinase [Rhodobacterales bacterium]
MITDLKPGAVHGSCVDFDGKAILAIGPSGSGKSSLALSLIALGGTLVSDDQVILTADVKGVTVSPPKVIAGKIEARHIGILNCPFVDRSHLRLIVDMSTKPKQRMPDVRRVTIGLHPIAVISGKETPSLPIAAKLLTVYGHAQTS